MNFRKAKGKQFDMVVIVRNARRTAADVDSSFTWQGNDTPHPKKPKSSAGRHHAGSRPCIYRQPHVATMPAFRRAQAVVGGMHLAKASMGFTLKFASQLMSMFGPAILDDDFGGLWSSEDVAACLAANPPSGIYALRERSNRSIQRTATPSAER